MLKYDESPESGAAKLKTEPRSKVNLMLSLHSVKNNEKKKLLLHWKTQQCGTVILQSDLIISHCKP